MVVSAAALAVAIWLAITPSATADSSFVGDMLVCNDREPGYVLAFFDPTTGAYQGVFANLGPNYDAQTLAQGPDGNIYVASPQGSIFEYNAATGQQVTAFQFSTPYATPSMGGMAFDGSGNLYAVEYLAGSANWQINEFNATIGSYIRTVVDNLSAAVGLTYASGNLYVTDSAGIQQFSTNGSLGITFSGNATRSTDVTSIKSRPGPTVNLYATDGISSVYEFTPSGTQVGSGPFVTGVYGAYGPGFGPDGSLYVAGNGPAVYKFGPDGTMVGSGPFFNSDLLVYGTSVLYDAAGLSSRAQLPCFDGAGSCRRRPKAPLGKTSKESSESIVTGSTRQPGSGPRSMIPPRARCCSRTARPAEAEIPEARSRQKVFDHRQESLRRRASHNRRARRPRGK